MRYIVNKKGKTYRIVLSGKCDISRKFSQLKGDAEQCSVDSTDALVIPLRKRTGKVGRLPGCRVRDRVHVAHLVLDVDLAARAAHSVLDVAGKALVGHSAQASVLAGSGACPMKCWRCALRPRR